MRPLLLFGSLFLSLFSHDVWIVPNQNGGTFHYGHRAPEAGEAKELPFDPAQVTYSCQNTSGHTAGWKAGCDELVARFEGGVWSKTFDGTQKGSRAEHPEALTVWQSREVVCYIRHPLLAAPAGFALRPVELDGAALGERLTIRATVDGQPLAGIPVAYFGSVRGVTDSDGKINIRLRHPGIQQIAASRTTQNNNPAIDKTITSYTLNFKVKK